MLVLFQTRSFWLHKTLINRLEWCGLLWCFYQLFWLSFWRHPFTAEDPLVSKCCNATFIQMCFYFWVNYPFNHWLNNWSRTFDFAIWHKTYLANPTFVSFRKKHVIYAHELGYKKTTECKQASAQWWHLHHRLQIPELLLRSIFTAAELFLSGVYTRVSAPPYVLLQRRER